MLSATTVPHLLSALGVVAVSCMLLAGPAASQIASVPPPTSSHCLPFKSTVCGGVGWSNTSLPNFLLLSDVDTIEKDLQQYLPLYATGCSNALLHVLCAVYYPPCFAGLDGRTHIILPCFELCEYVRCTCDSAVEALGAVWPQEFNCSNFPIGRQGQLCYPGDTAITFFRQELTLPTIEGESHPEPQRCGDTPTTTTVLPTDEVTQEDSPSTCPVAAFAVPNTTAGPKGYALAGVSGCGLPCNPSLLVPGHSLAAVASLTTLGSALGLLALLFTLATVGIGRERFPYPQRPFAFMAISYCTMTVIQLTNGMRLLGSGAPACDNALPSAFTAQGLPLAIGESHTAQQSLCIATATFLYYSTMASLVWWVILTFTWFLATVLKWAEEAIQKLWLLYHALGWGVPLVLLILVLAIQQVGGELATGTCYVGNSSLLGLGLFVLAPTVVSLLLALLLFAASMVALLRILQEVRSEHDRAFKVRLLLIRVSVFTTFVAVPNLVLVLLQIYEMVKRPLWEQEALCHVATPTERSSTPLCSLPGEPAPFGYYIVKNMVWMSQVVSVVTWVLSRKTLESWKVFGNSMCSFVWQRRKPADENADSPGIQP